MKFGKDLAKHRNQHVKYGCYYLDYKALKRAIKTLEADKTTKGAERTEMTSLFRKELEMINKTTELVYEGIRGRLSNLMAPRKPMESGPARQEFEELEQDIIFLTSFIEINHTGFIKITKKCDKRLGTGYQAWFLPTVKEASFRRRNLQLLTDNLETLQRQQGQDANSATAGTDRSGGAMAALERLPGWGGGKAQKFQQLQDPPRAVAASDAPPRPAAAAKADDPAGASSTRSLSAWWRNLCQALSAPAVNPAATVRVDVKTPLANERTVLRWMRSAVAIAAAGAFLLSRPESFAKTNGLLLTILSLLYTVWPALVFWQRSVAFANPFLTMGLSDQALVQVLGFGVMGVLMLILFMDLFLHEDIAV